MSLALQEPDMDDDDTGTDAPPSRHYDDDSPEPYIPEPTPEESDYYARLWWAGRLG